MSRRYRPLDHPLPVATVSEGVSPLNLLYPGRPMQTNYPYNREYIPHEYPQEASAMFRSNQQQTLSYARSLEAQTRDEGKDGKVFNLPAVAPEATIQDPDLKYVRLGAYPQVGPFYQS